MKNFISNFADTPEKKRLIGNFSALSLIQAANYILPLITFPYLIRVIGVSWFGLIAFANALTAYFRIVTDYSFNLSATREVSLLRDDRQAVASVFSAVLAVKLMFSLLGFGVLLALVLTVPKLAENRAVYLLAYGVVFSSVLFPVWYFQGIEKMKSITVFNLLAKALYTVCIFAFVHAREHYWLVPLFNSAASIIAGFLSLLAAVKVFEVRLGLPSIAAVRSQLKKGWVIFISNITISLYTVSNTFILGLIAPHAVVGCYAGADRIVRAVTSLLVPLSNAVYPFISLKARQSQAAALRWIRRIGSLALGLNLGLSIFLFLFADWICRLILGPECQGSVIILKILAFLPAIICISNFAGVQGLYAFGRETLVARYLVPIGLFHIILLVFLTGRWQQTGTAAAVVITEGLIALFAFLVFYLAVYRKVSQTSA